MIQTDPQQLKPFLNSPKRYLVYVTSLLAQCSFLGLIGGYAMLKKDLAEEIGIEEGQLGILDGANYLTRLFTVIYLLFRPIHHPRKVYSIHTTLIAILMFMIPLAPRFQPYTYMILVAIFLASGFSRGFNFIPQFIVNQYFDADGPDATKMRIWISITGYGDVIAILSMHLFLNVFHWNWKICLWIAIATYLLISILFEVTCDEIPIERPRRQGEESGEEQSPFFQTFTDIKLFLSNPGNFLWLITISLLNSLYYSVLLWAPYYFQKIGLEHEAAFISIGPPMFLPLGVVFFNFLINKFTNKEVFLINLFIGLEVIVCSVLSFMPKQKQLAWLYLILLLVMGLLFSGPWAYFYTNQMRRRSPGVHSYYIAIIMLQFTVQGFITLEMITIGFLSQIKLQSLFYCLFALSGVVLIINVVRNDRYPLQPALQPAVQLSQNQQQ